MNYNNVSLETKDHVCILSINHPPVNSFNYSTIQDMELAVDEIESNREIRAVIITGAGEKGFSSGFDVTDVANAGAMEKKGSVLWTRLENMSKPIIAAMNGFALGAGCELALACHFRIIEDKPKARISLPELKLGMFPLWGGTQRLPMIVGKTKALEMILLSKEISPAEALETGIVYKISREGELMKDALDLAHRLSQAPPLAVKSTLKAMNTGLDKGISEGLKVELEEIGKVKNSKDIQEGFLAFFEKRTPVFTGE